MCKISVEMCLCDMEKARKQERERAQKIIEELNTSSLAEENDYGNLTIHVGHIDNWKQEALNKLNS